MTSGGARNRSGPQKDPNSQTSQRKGFTLRSLPPEGRKGRAPKYPLPPFAAFYLSADGERINDDALSEQVNRREMELWKWAWGTPQACAWDKEPWRWYSVATWVRTAVTCEQADAKAADKTALLRLADQIGLTPAGLRENGWQIAAAECADESEPTKANAKKSSRDRMSLKVVNGGAA